MPTGYEAQMYRDITTIAGALGELPRLLTAADRIADALEALSRQAEAARPVAGLATGVPVGECGYCREQPADAGYDRCFDCRTWRDEEWCEVRGLEHGSDEARDFARQP